MGMGAEMSRPLAGKVADHGVGAAVALCALFEQTWEAGCLAGERTPADDNGCTPMARTRPTRGAPHRYIGGVDQTSGPPPRHSTNPGSARSASCASSIPAAARKIAMSSYR